MKQAIRGNRKTKQGVVLSNKMAKTVVVNVTRTCKDKNYGKVITRDKKYFAHHEGDIKVGDQVTIEETRPTSKLKRWRVVSIKGQNTE